MAGGIAHDFNNILAAIRGNAGLAMDEVTDRRSPVESAQEIQLPWVVADADQLHEAVVNRTTNAAHAIGSRPGPHACLTATDRVVPRSP